MVRVQLDTDTRRRYSLRAGPTWTTEEDVHDVDPETARYLVEDSPDSVTFEALDEIVDEPEPEPEPEEEDVDEDDTSGFDEDAWLDQDYETRADRVADGDVDDVLSEVAAVETSATVEEAVEERRAELEG